MRGGGGVWGEAKQKREILQQTLRLPRGGSMFCCFLLFFCCFSCFLVVFCLWGVVECLCEFLFGVVLEVVCVVFVWRGFIV